jgi:EF-P beta-lysylation protein EpmB
MQVLEQAYSWQEELAQVVTQVDKLCEFLDLDPIQLTDSYKDLLKQFGLRVPRPYLSRIEKGNLHDPLLKQVLPVAQELQIMPGYSTDPLQEKNCNPVPGLLHKYQGRVLLTLTGGCAIHCRYCFRRHFPYAQNAVGSKTWADIFAYLQKHSDINEVIFSGGDPLLLEDEALAALVADLETLPHLKRLRIHTRLPIVIPQRVTAGLIKLLSQTRLQTILVVHCNHANEIDDSVKKHLSLLKQANILLLNQSVLLAGINDSTVDLINLSEKLFSAHVLPYYIHLLDRVQGAAHFDVDESRGRKLIWEITQLLPGYLVPKLVKEVHGQTAKVAV